MNLNIRKMITLFSLLAVLIPNLCLALLEEDEEVIKSFMPGMIRRIAVMPGQQIKRVDLLYIFEVMKMECSVTSPKDGFIGSLYFTVDQIIEKDMPLITILPFMHVEKRRGPMDVNELPCPVFEITAPFTEAINNEEGISNLSSSESVIIPTEKFTFESVTIPTEQFSSETELIPEIIDSEENASDVSLPNIVITLPVEQSVFENEPQTTQQEEMLPLVVGPITEIFDNEGEGADISLSVLEPKVLQQEDKLPLAAVPIIEIPKSEECIFDVLPSSMIPFVEQSVSENEPQTSQQELMLPLVVDPITIPLNVSDISDVSPPAGVIESEAKPFISDHQALQQVSKSFWIAAASTSLHNDEVEGEVASSLPSVIANEAKPSIFKVENLPQAFQQKVTSFLFAALSSRPDLPFNLSKTKTFNDDETGISSSLQKVKEEELRQELNTPMASFHLPWLTGLLLLGFLFFCRAKPIMSYRVKNILIHKDAVNLNIPGYLRDAA